MNSPLPTGHSGDIPGESASGEGAKAKPGSLSLMPAPFAWVEIPGGHGTMETNESNTTLAIPTENYWISKYPITNAQFAKFIEADGYRERRWWTNADWKQREKDGWTEPRFWTDRRGNGAEQPVVGVTWYEAVAFCRWLSAVSGEQIMLPTEAQWQYASQGTDEHAYPWGNDWDGKRCNNAIAFTWWLFKSKPDGHGEHTTSVRAYEGKGDSLFGVVDMTGNVWEWCLTDYEKKTNEVESQAEMRVLRGGSWDYSLTEGFRCDFRGGADPYRWDGSWGFRIARS